MKKRILLFFLLFISLFTLSSCSSNKADLVYKYYNYETHLEDSYIAFGNVYDNSEASKVKNGFFFRFSVAVESGNLISINYKINVVNKSTGKVNYKKSYTENVNLCYNSVVEIIQTNNNYILKENDVVIIDKLTYTFFNTYDFFKFIGIAFVLLACGSIGLSTYYFINDKSKNKIKKI